MRASKDFGHGSTSAFVDFCLTTPSLTADQIQTLAWHLTIGETYFLRGGQTFTVLEREVLPELLLARRNGERQLRLWSAGCAGGEEPYSLAITVSRLIADLSEWNVTILATDINTRALHKASEGVYSNWSFRDTPDWLRPQFFARTAAGDWAIRPEIKRRVTFSYLNLAADPYPSLATNTNAMDIIFCRNVLMYFSADTMRRGRRPAPRRAARRRLPVRGAERGVARVLPAVRAGHLAGRDLLPQSAAGGRRRTDTARPPGKASRRHGRSAGDARADGAGAGAGQTGAGLATGQAGAAGRKPAPRPVARAAPAGREPAVRDGAPTALAAGAAVLAASARRAANEGRLGEALKDCEEAIGADKLSADYRYLQATILGELDRDDDAVKALNSALYLDPRFVLAHFLYGNIARRRSRSADADSHFRTTLSLLEELSPDDVLPESEGMTAGKLAEIVRSILQLEAAP